MTAVLAQAARCCVYVKPPKIMQLMHGIDIWVLARSSCSSPSTKELHVLTMYKYPLYNSKFDFTARRRVTKMKKWGRNWYVWIKKNDRPFLRAFASSNDISHETLKIWKCEPLNLLQSRRVIQSTLPQSIIRHLLYLRQHLKCLFVPTNL